MVNKAVEALKANLQQKLREVQETGGPGGGQGEPDGPRSRNARGAKQNLPAEREGHSGRRGDILEDFHNKTGMYAGREDNAQPPVILKVTIAGSGCQVWMSHAKANGKKNDTELARIDAPGKDGWIDWAPAAYTNNKGDLTFSGPQKLGGSSDTGKNSINNLVATVPDIILSALPPDCSSGENVVLLLKSHSRGAVAASMIAKRLKMKLPAMRVELTQFDPVPGPGNYREKSETVVGEWTNKAGRDVPVDAALDESTIVYSLASGYGHLGTSFVPQKVHGAKRIIISRQNHGGGLIKGYMVEGKTFKGARLNSLPPGAYYESELIKNGEHAGVIKLLKMTEVNLLEVLDATYKNAVAKISDYGRYNLVKEALREFFRTNG